MQPHNERQNFDRFRALVLADPELHAQLRATEDQASFIVLAVRLGAERGCEFTSTTAEFVLREQRRAWLERWL